MQVYQVLLEDKGKNFIFLRLPEKCVSELNLTCDQEFHAEVKIYVNFCRWTLDVLAIFHIWSKLCYLAVALAIVIPFKTS